jgi:predicted TIM-barrel fold metal-dependent hydrolase
VPHVEATEDGDRWFDGDRVTYGLVNGTSGGGAKHVPGAHHRIDRMAETGLYEDGKKGIRRVSDPHLRLKEMERDGVDAEVIFGPLALLLQMKDPAVMRETLRIYNDWMAKDFGAHYPDRQLGLACVPLDDIDYAVKEIHRVAKLGLPGIDLPHTPNMVPLWHPQWEPVWQAIAEVDLPMHFHTFPIVGNFPPMGDEHRPARLFTIVSTFQVYLFSVLAGIISSGALERYPNLRVAFGESGIGWLPYAFDRMDFEWDDQFKFGAMGQRLKMKPSDYARRQCRFSFQYEKIGSKLVDLIGIETLMWGSDFPHGDGVWPDSGDAIEEQFGHLPAAQTRKIVCDNAVAFYRLSNNG